MKKVFLWVLLLCLFPIFAHAQILVAVEDGSLNGSGADLAAQLNDDTWADFTATVVTAADIDTLAEISVYDVVILGGSGYADNDWTLEMANALSQFVTAGGGAVLTGWGLHGMNYGPQSSLVSDVLEVIFPGQNMGGYSADSSGATLEIVQTHPVTLGLTDFAISAGTACCTELNPRPPEAGDTVLATMTGNMAVSVKNPGSGFSVYLGPIYMARDTYAINPNLRVGDPDRLLEQAVAWAGSGEVLESDNAIFKVSKTFSDQSTDEVDVTLTCNAGLPLEQSFTIAGGDAGVSFTVTNLPTSGATCTVTESGGPDGYTPEMNDGAGCTWSNVSGGVRVCAIQNVADDASFTVNMEWEVTEAGAGNEFEQEVPVTIWCDTMIVPGTQDGGGDWYHDVVLGDGDSAIVMVDVSAGTASCWATQDTSQASGVGSSGDCGPQAVGVGEPASCTFTNTMFFEGIPSLNQMGLAIMALLFLGVGLIGFRRIA